MDQSNVSTSKERHDGSGNVVVVVVVVVVIVVFDPTNLPLKFG